MPDNAPSAAGHISWKSHSCPAALTIEPFGGPDYEEVPYPVSGIRVTPRHLHVCGRKRQGQAQIGRREKSGRAESGGSEPTAPANVTDPDLAANTPEKVHDKLCKAGESAANLFYVIDTQQTGKVTPADLQAFVKKIESADKSNKGYVTADDMVAAANTSARHRMMWKLDNKYDKDNDGTVSIAELGKDANLYKGLDVNKDGVIGNDDFTAIGQRACVATNARGSPSRRSGPF